MSEVEHALAIVRRRHALRKNVDFEPIDIWLAHSRPLNSSFLQPWHRPAELFKLLDRASVDSPEFDLLHATGFLAYSFRWPLVLVRSNRKIAPKEYRPFAERGSPSFAVAHYLATSQGRRWLQSESKHRKQNLQLSAGTRQHLTGTGTDSIQNFVDDIVSVDSNPLTAATYYSIRFPRDRYPHEHSVHPYNLYLKAYKISAIAAREITYEQFRRYAQIRSDSHGPAGDVFVPIARRLNRRPFETSTTTKRVTGDDEGLALEYAEKHELTSQRFGLLHEDTVQLAIKTAHAHASAGNLALGGQLLRETLKSARENDAPTNQVLELLRAGGGPVCFGGRIRQGSPHTPPSSGNPTQTRLASNSGSGRSLVYYPVGDCNNEDTCRRRRTASVTSPNNEPNPSRQITPCWPTLAWNLPSSS